jgi:4'-phosphopantetheinyl transferase
MNPELKEEEVHVWSASIAVSPSQTEKLLGALSSDEISRARRFHRQRDRQRFILCRGLLRLILSRYLGLEPSELVFRYSPYGKPFLVNIGDQIRLDFNLAHSNILALFAITQDREAGIDVEHIRRDFPWEEMVDPFLSNEENEVLHALPKGLQCEAFFRRWTGKEAYLKARGEGISLPLEQIEMSSVPGCQGEGSLPGIKRLDARRTHPCHRLHGCSRCAGDQLATGMLALFGEQAITNPGTEYS